MKNVWKRVWKKEGKTKRKEETGGAFYYRLKAVKNYCCFFRSLWKKVQSKNRLHRQSSSFCCLFDVFVLVLARRRRFQATTKRVFVCVCLGRVHKSVSFSCSWRPLDQTPELQPQEIKSFPVANFNYLTTKLDRPQPSTFLLHLLRLQGKRKQKKPAQQLCTVWRIIAIYSLTAAAVHTSATSSYFFGFFLYIHDSFTFAVCCFCFCSSFVVVIAACWCRCWCRGQKKKK